MADNSKVVVFVADADALAPGVKTEPAEFFGPTHEQSEERLLRLAEVIGSENDREPVVG